MESNNTDDLEAFISNPNGRRYWTKSRRDVICRIFRQEILDETLILPHDKVTEAIDELNEEKSRQMRARIRTFIYRIRKSRLKVIETDKEPQVQNTSEPHSAPKRQRMGKRDVKPSMPSINSSGSANDDTRTDSVITPPGGNKVDKMTENCNGDDRKEANPNPDAQPLHENESSTLECDEYETKFDPVHQSWQEKCMDFENNNEVSFSPTNQTACYPPDMISVMKTNLAQKLSTSYQSSDTTKVDFAINFLKSKGFEGLTREIVFAWSDALLKGIFDHNPAPLFNQMTECLVRAIAHGEIDWKFILESYVESGDLSEIFEDLIRTKEMLPVETLSSVIFDEGCNMDNQRILDSSSIKEGEVDESMQNQSEANVDDPVSSDVSLVKKEGDETMPNEREDNMDDQEVPDVSIVKEEVDETKPSEQKGNLNDPGMSTVSPVKDGVFEETMPCELDAILGDPGTSGMPPMEKPMPCVNNTEVHKMNSRKRKSSQ